MGWECRDTVNQRRDFKAEQFLSALLTCFTVEFVCRHCRYILQISASNFSLQLAYLLFIIKQTIDQQSDYPHLKKFKLHYKPRLSEGKTVQLEAMEIARGKAVPCMVEKEAASCARPLVRERVTQSITSSDIDVYFK